jgi:hypothetical protein
MVEWSEEVTDRQRSVEREVITSISVGLAPPVPGSGGAYNMVAVIELDFAFEEETLCGTGTL